MTIETTTVPALQVAYWRAEAEKMHEVLAKLRRFCDRQHGDPADFKRDCQCPNCSTKRRVALIISDGMR